VCIAVYPYSPRVTVPPNIVNHIKLPPIIVTPIATISVPLKKLCKGKLAKA
jgi:hypothetical protein